MHYGQDKFIMVGTHKVIVLYKASVTPGSLIVG